VRGLGHQSFSPAWLLVAVGLQHEPAPGVVQLFVAAFAADHRLVGHTTRGTGRARFHVVRVVAAQRRQRVPQLRFARFRMGRHAEPGAGSDAVTVTHSAHPLTLERT